MVTAALLDRFGAPDVLKLGEYELRRPARDECLVEVRACGVNFHDVDIRRGASGRDIPLPLVLGREISGVVVAAAADGTGPQPGTPVAVAYSSPCEDCRPCRDGRDHMCQQRQMFGVTRDGGYATHVIAPSRAAIPLRDESALVPAAAGQISYSTALHAMSTRGRVQAGDRVLVTGATGGVGSACIDVGHRLGAHVVAGVGADFKVAVAKEFGADEVWLLRGEDYRSTSTSNPVARVDVVIDTVGGDAFAAGLRALEPGGTFVMVGGHGGEVVPLNIVNAFRREFTIVGSARATRAELAEVLNGVTDKVYVPRVSLRAPLADVADVHRAMEAREVVGKVVLTP